MPPQSQVPSSTPDTPATRAMKLRTRLNLVVTGLTAVFVAVVVLDEIRDTRSSVREEIEAANRVAAQVLGRLTVIYAEGGRTDLPCSTCSSSSATCAPTRLPRSASGDVLYHSPPATYKAGREAPPGSRGCLPPQPARRDLPAARRRALGGRCATLAAVLDAWDEIVRLWRSSAPSC